MQLVDLARGDVELEVLLDRVGEQGLDVFPGDHLLARPGGEEPGREPVDEPEPAEPAEDAAQAVVGVDDPQLVLDGQEVDVVDPLDLRPEGIDDLLVQELVAEEDLVGGHLDRVGASPPRPA